MFFLGLIQEYLKIYLFLVKFTFPSLFQLIPASLYIQYGANVFKPSLNFFASNEPYSFI